MKRISKKPTLGKYASVAKMLPKLTSNYGPKRVEVDFITNGNLKGQCYTERESYKKGKEDSEDFINSDQGPHLETSKMCETEQHQTKPSPTSGLRGSLASHLKYAVSNGMLEECNEVQNIVRNSVESLAKVLGKGNSTATFKLSCQETSCGDSGRYEYKTSSQRQGEHLRIADTSAVMKSNPGTARVPQTTTSILKPKKCFEEIIPRKVVACDLSEKSETRSRSLSAHKTLGNRAIKPSSCEGDKETSCKVAEDLKYDIKYSRLGILLLAAYKGWKTRKVFQTKEAKDFINEIGKLKAKLRLIKSANQSGKHVLMNVYNFKKQQFKNLLEAKLGAFGSVNTRRKTLDGNKKVTEKKFLYQTAEKKAATKQVSPAKRRQTRVPTKCREESHSSTKKSSPSEKHWREADVEEDMTEPSASMPRGSIAPKRFGNQSMEKPVKPINAMQTLAKLNALISKVKIEKKLAKANNKAIGKAEQWGIYDKKFTMLMEDLRLAYENIKKC